MAARSIYSQSVLLGMLIANGSVLKTKPESSSFHIAYLTFVTQADAILTKLGIQGAMKPLSLDTFNDNVNQIKDALIRSRDLLCAGLYFFSATVSMSALRRETITNEDRMLFTLFGFALQCVDAISEVIDALPDPDAVVQRLIALMQALDARFHSCFISYASDDEEFATRLYERLKREGIDVWYAPKSVHAGQKLADQIDTAIRNYDKVVVILSDASIESSWVREEIRRAMVLEADTGSRKLFPIRLVPFSKVQALRSFVADLVRDMGVELREYFIPDFRDWRTERSFEEAAKKLIDDLRKGTNG